MASIETIISLFRHDGLKITPQRRVMFELLSRDDSHPTAEEIYQRMLAVMPDISRTTVYNTLHEMVRLGALNMLEHLSEGEMRYDTNRDLHHHLFCINCHKLVDIHQDFQGLKLLSEEAAGYRIIKSQVTFYGICPDCQVE